MDPSQPNPNDKPTTSLSNSPTINHLSQSSSLPPPPPVPRPTVFTDSTASGQSYAEPTSRHSFKLVFILLGLLLFLTVTASGVLAGVAYEKININNPALAKNIAHLVM